MPDTTDPGAEGREAVAAGATLLLAVHIPNAEGTEDADIVASEFVQMINEERDRNGTHWQTPDEMVTVSLWPTPQFLTGDQLQELGALIAERDRYREVVEAARKFHGKNSNHADLPFPCELCEAIDRLAALTPLTPEEEG
jgi:hypothetical protein